MALHVGELPDFPWDSLTPFVEQASRHPDGPVVLSVGTPVDPTPEVLQQALIGAANAPGYPATYGTPALREAVATWYARRRGARALDPDGVLPTIGSKEFVATLPALLGIGEGDMVVFPAAAYPTYDVGATLAGATTLATDDVADWSGNKKVKLVWLNSPSNPTGAVMSRDQMRDVVAAARDIGAIVASDECYAELVWDGDEPASSILDDAVCAGDHSGLLATYSLSKQSNLAGYRAAFTAGDPEIVRALLEVRKHAGFIVPAPVQAAIIAGVEDDDHVAEQRERYRARRAKLRDALEEAGFTIEHSEAGLYLWATRGEDCWDTIAWLAELGIVAAPGSFYGAAGGRHVRVAITATDERVDAAAARLRAVAGGN